MNIRYISVDVEADGPCPGIYSMIGLGAVCVDDTKLNFCSKLIAPITDRYSPEALKAIAVTREDTIQHGDDPGKVMDEFSTWISQICAHQRPVFVSDNNGFDWQFVNYYFHKYIGNNPFGYSSVNIGSLYKGLSKSMRANFKHLRDTPHTHNPLDDAMGNAEAMRKILRMMK